MGSEPERVMVDEKQHQKEEKEASKDVNKEIMKHHNQFEQFGGVTVNALVNALYTLHGKPKAKKDLENSQDHKAAKGGFAFHHRKKKVAKHEKRVWLEMYQL